MQAHKVHKTFTVNEVVKREWLNRFSHKMHLDIVLTLLNSYVVVKLLILLLWSFSWRFDRLFQNLRAHIFNRSFNVKDKIYL